MLCSNEIGINKFSVDLNIFTRRSMTTFQYGTYEPTPTYIAMSQPILDRNSFKMSRMSCNLFGYTF
jgi:hypothetical protein